MAHGSSTRFISTLPALPVRDTQAAVTFYCNHLGFHVVHQEDGFARLRRTEVELLLWRAGDETWRDRSGEIPFNAIVSGAESFLAGTASCRIEVEGLDALYREYSEQGILHPTASDITIEWWGERDFHTLDPDGNLLTFFERNWPSGATG